ncbi:MAG: SMC-Scp complex subunit ScpB, partial [Candidatus Moranbacteria bacterium]|nr:SMC-Scp complex subunit ScpB [Candidatus Moranbacteria bacterium]
LFVSGEPVSFDRLAKVLEVTVADIHTALGRLSERYATDQTSGLMLIQDKKTVVLATKPENSLALEMLTKSTLQESMSKAALEVLAIIAYRAPVSRAEIDAIRGVNCSFTLRNLLLRDLISREGNPSDSRGYLYQPTLRFLQALGLTSVSELPSYEVLSQDERLKMILEEEGKENAPEKTNESIQEN